MKGHERTDVDLEIANAEVRIQYHRRRLHDKAQALEDSFRSRFSSPGVLLAAAATGYLLGALTTPDRGTRRSPLGRLFATLTEALRLALKFAHTGPVVWLATTIGASRAQQSEHR